MLRKLSAFENVVSKNHTSSLVSVLFVSFLSHLMFRKALDRIVRHDLNLKPYRPQFAQELNVNSTDYDKRLRFVDNG